MIMIIMIMVITIIIIIIIIIMITCSFYSLLIFSITCGVNDFIIDFSLIGIFAGINMSGDLYNPKQNIPVGTLSAVSVSTFLYMAFVLVLGATCVRDVLQTDYMIAEKVRNHIRCIKNTIWYRYLDAYIYLCY